MQGLRITLLPDGRKAVILRTSDRIAFKQCRRKWAWSSHLKYNLSPVHLAAPLWFGSAVHYALEDYHGYNRFGRPAEAFKAYCISTAQNWKRDLPSDAQEHYRLGIAVLDYYVDKWLAAYPRKADETYWDKNPTTGKMEPQVEVNFEIPIPIDMGGPLLRKYCEELGIDVILYRGTIDRIGIDEWGFLWIIEYKTAKVFQTTHFPTDPQCTAYVWATEQIYDREVAGVIYHQFGKRMPKGPALLAGGGLSTAQNMVTSYPLYKDSMERLYGSVEHSPSKNQTFLNQLIKAENSDRDRYIIRDKVYRNDWQSSNELQKILLELEDYLNPDLPLYPNPTRDCARLCSFLTPCVNLDDGSDWEALLAQTFIERDLPVDRMWRQRLPSPNELWALTAQDEEPDLIGIQTIAVEEAKLAQIAAGDYDLPEWQTGSGGYTADGFKDPTRGMNEDGSFNMREVD